MSGKDSYTDKLTSFEKSDIDNPLDTVTQAEEFDLRGFKKSNSDEPYNTLPHAQQIDLQAGTLEQKKINRMTNNNTSGVINDKFIFGDHCIFCHNDVKAYPVPYSLVFEVDGNLTITL